MKLMNTFSLPLIALLWAFCVSHIPASEPILPTSEVKIEASVTASQSVMLCRLVDLGWVDFRGPAEHVYENAKFDVVSTLKGLPLEQVSCSIRVLGYPLEANEKDPIVGESYLVMGDTKEGKFMLQKLLAATPENIASVQRMVSILSLPIHSSFDSSSDSLAKPSLPGDSKPTSVISTAILKQPTLEQKTTSEVSWLVWVVLMIIAAGGLVGLWLKQRK